MKLRIIFSSVLLINLCNSLCLLLDLFRLCFRLRTTLVRSRNVFLWGRMTNFRSFQSHLIFEQNLIGRRNGRKSIIITSEEEDEVKREKLRKGNFRCSNVFLGCTTSNEMNANVNDMNHLCRLKSTEKLLILNQAGNFGAELRGSQRRKR